MSLQNNCRFDGRISSDLKFQQDSEPKSARLNFSIAVKDGYDKNKSVFVNFVAFGVNAVNINKYFSKGKPISIIAEYATWKQDKEGKTNYYHNFKLTSWTFPLTVKSEGNEENTKSYPKNNTKPKPVSDMSFGGEFDDTEEDDDDIPF